MTTRNYKLSLDVKKVNLGEISETDPSCVYKFFKENYKESLTEREVPIIYKDRCAINIYDINNVSVMCYSNASLRIVSNDKNPKKSNYANLRIIGLESNIKMTEEEIKLKGFILEQLR